LAEDTTDSTTTPVAEAQPVPVTYDGRHRLLTSNTDINRTNILEVLDIALGIHKTNAMDEDWLWRYYKGWQPILDRTKDVRPEICNRVVENRANQIVSFKVGYLVGEPVVYTARSGADSEASGEADDEMSRRVQRLNDMMVAEDKAAEDRDLVQWQMVCGTSYRLVLPDKDLNTRPDDVPFEIHTLDPRHTFVVYCNDVAKEPVLGVTYVKDEQTSREIYSCYTDTTMFTITNHQIVSEQPHSLGAIPIVEYPANPERMGCFEAVLPLLNAINLMESNRLDGVEQFVQALMVFKNVDIDAKNYREMLALGAIKINSAEGVDGSVDMLVSTLDQGQTQVLVDNLYSTALDICGMPRNQGGGASTSDTGAAVMLRDGWSLAETRAKDSELTFKRSERRFLGIVLGICDTAEHLKLSQRNVDIKFTRRNYEAIQSKAQVFSTLMGVAGLHPRLAFEYCGLFSDPETAYADSKSYSEAKAATAQALFASPQGNDAGDGDSIAGDGASVAGGADATRDTKANPTEGTGNGND